MDEPRQPATFGDEGAPVIEPGYTFGTVTDKIASIVLTRPTSNGWFLGFGIAFLLTMMMLYAVGYLFVRGVGENPGLLLGGQPREFPARDQYHRHQLRRGAAGL